MKYRFREHGFFAAGRRLAPALLMSAALPLAACTTASIDDVAPATSASAPAASTAPQPVPRPDEPGVSEQALATVEGNAAAAEPATGPRNSGVYPNLNVTPGTAAAQLTPAEKAAMLAELRAKQEGAAAAVAKARPADQLEALRELGERHGDDVLKEIEKKPE
jgi:hypothetical protein